MEVLYRSRPVIGDPAVSRVLVVEGHTGPDLQKPVADVLAGEWSSAPWPDTLLAADCFVSTDGSSVLAYVQWSSDAGADAAAGGPWAAASPALEPLIGRRALAEAVRFRLYRRVHGGAEELATSQAQCFPAATFTMPDAEAAQAWVDGLLSAEEETEGENREYPGALAANFHVGGNGAVFLLSEWISEQEAVDHIESVIEPLLTATVPGGADAGLRYRHHFTARVASAPDIRPR